MHNFHYIFYLLLFIFAIIGLLFQIKLKRLLLEKEKIFCESISLTNSFLTDSPRASWKFLMLIVFDTNRESLSNGEVLVKLKKAKIFFYIYIVIFFIYVAFFLAVASGVCQGNCGVPFSDRINSQIIDHNIFQLSNVFATLCVITKNIFTITAVS